MIRGAELAVFLLPLLAFGLWRLSVARGLSGPPNWQLGLIFAVLLGLAASLYAMAARERLPPGAYVPAQVVDGRVVPGHSR